jgi:hypothetical protein
MYPIGGFPAGIPVVYTFSADIAVSFQAMYGGDIQGDGISVILKNSKDPLYAIVEVDEATGNDIVWGGGSAVSPSTGLTIRAGEVWKLEGAAEINDFYAANKVAGSNAKLRLQLYWDKEAK